MDSEKGSQVKPAPFFLKNRCKATEKINGPGGCTEKSVRVRESDLEARSDQALQFFFFGVCEVVTFCILVVLTLLLDGRSNWPLTWT